MILSRRLEAVISVLASLRFSAILSNINDHRYNQYLLADVLRRNAGIQISQQTQTRRHAMVKIPKERLNLPDTISVRYGSVKHEGEIASFPSRDQSSQRVSSYLCWEHRGWHMRVSQASPTRDFPQQTPFSILHTPSYVLEKLRCSLNHFSTIKRRISHRFHQSVQDNSQVQSGRSDEATF